MKQIKLLLVLLLVLSLSVIVGCSKTTYVVSFDTDCEQTIASQEVVENEKATKPGLPNLSFPLYVIMFRVRDWLARRSHVSKKAYDEILWWLTFLRMTSLSVSQTSSGSNSGLSWASQFLE